VISGFFVITLADDSYLSCLKKSTTQVRTVNVSFEIILHCLLLVPVTIEGNKHEFKHVPHTYVYPLLWMV